MSDNELKQTVKLQEGKEVEQSVSYDPADKWVHLCHGDHEVSLSLENYHQLLKLAERVVPKE